MLHQEMKEVIKKRKDIVFYIKFFPIKKGTIEQIKSIACSKSLTMLEAAYDRKDVAVLDCAKNISIEKMTGLAKSLGIRSVPTLIMSDGRIHSGYVQSEQLIEIIDGRR